MNNTIVTKAYGKVNLALDVLRKRADGYHELRMIMQTVGLYDMLEITAIEDEQIILTSDVNQIPRDGNNLVYRAAMLMKDTYKISGGFRIYLQKQIPIAAGMAGGSADAAATLRGINELCNLAVPTDELCRLGKTLGADVPYCIIGGTVLAEGIGEKLTVLPAIDVPAVLIVKPDFDVSTKYVYENLKADTLPYHPDIDGMVGAIQRGDVDDMIDRMSNVLETVTQRDHPLILQIKQTMLQLGAKSALMSGSGPSVFGIYPNKELADKAGVYIHANGMAKQIHVTTFTKGL